MEKYRKFADPFTGKNPFLPIFVNSKGKIIDHILHILLGSVLVVIRLPILALVLLLGILYNQVLERLIVISKLKRSITVIVNKLVFRIALACFGFYTVPTYFKGGFLNNLNGKLVYSNHTSPIDILYLYYILSPQFGKPVIPPSQEVYLDQEKKAGFQMFSFTQVLKLIFQRDFIIADQVQELQKSQDPVKIIEENYRNNVGPTVIFFEGANGNGNGVLKCEVGLLNAALQVSQQFSRNLIIFNIQYKRKDIYTPINTTRGNFFHLLALMTSLKNDMKVNVKSIQHPENGKIKEYIDSFEGFYKSCGQTILNLNYKVYINFLEFWTLANKSSKSANYTKEVKTEKSGQKYVM